MTKTMPVAIKEAHKKYKTTKNKHTDFHVGMKVKNISPCADFQFYHGGEKGIVTKVDKYYISVDFTPSLKIEGGGLKKTGCFDPKDLVLIGKKKTTVQWAKIYEKERQKRKEAESKLKEISEKLNSIIFTYHL